MVVAMSLAGCAAPAGWTDTAFQRFASDGASTFSASAALLEAAHTGSLTNTYLRGALVNLQESFEVSGAAKLAGAPSADQMAALAAAVEPGEIALGAPCIDAGCDWRAQVEAMRRASEALSRAVGR